MNAYIFSGLICIISNYNMQIICKEDDHTIILTLIACW